MTINKNFLPFEVWQERLRIRIIMRKVSTTIKQLTTALNCLNNSLETLNIELNRLNQNLKDAKYEGT